MAHAGNQVDVTAIIINQFRWNNQNNEFNHRLQVRKGSLMHKRITVTYLGPRRWIEHRLPRPDLDVCVRWQRLSGPVRSWVGLRCHSNGVSRATYSIQMSEPGTRAPRGPCSAPERRHSDSRRGTRTSRRRRTTPYSIASSCPIPRRRDPLTQISRSAAENRLPSSRRWTNHWQRLHLVAYWSLSSLLPRGAMKISRSTTREPHLTEFLTRNASKKNVRAENWTIVAGKHHGHVINRYDNLDLQVAPPSLHRSWPGILQCVCVPDLYIDPSMTSLCVCVCVCVRWTKKVLFTAWSALFIDFHR